MQTRIRRNLAVAATLFVCGLSACAEEAAPIAFDAPPTTNEPVDVTVIAPSPATTEPLAATSAADDNGDWRDATGNLAGLDSECGNLSYVKPRPDRPALITGVALQGLWSTSDRGQSWEALGQGEGSADVTFRTTDIQFDPDDPDRFWVSGLYGTGGLFETKDDGATFQQVGYLWSTEDVGIDFTDPSRETLVAALQGDIAVYRSADGGTTWEDITGRLPVDGGVSTGVMVLDSDSYLLGTRDGPVPGIFRTEDGGSTWTRVQPSGVVGAPLVVADGSILWLLDRGAGVATSVDDGASWTTTSSDDISPFAASLVELPDGSLATYSDSTIIVSTDQGTTWEQFGPALPYDPTGMTYSQFDNAYFVWRADCDFAGENPVRSGAIMRLDVDDING